MEDMTTNVVAGELLRPRDVVRVLGLKTRNVLYGWDKAELFPAAVRIGGIRYWRRAELLAWVNSGCPVRSDWRWQPGLAIKLEDLHQLRCRQIADLNSEILELKERLARGESLVHVNGR